MNEIFEPVGEFRALDIEPLQMYISELSKKDNARHTKPNQTKPQYHQKLHTKLLFLSQEK